MVSFSVAVRVASRTTRCLKEASVARANLLVTVTPDNEKSLTICQMAKLIDQKEKSNSSRAVGRVKDSQHEGIFQEWGIVLPP